MDILECMENRRSIRRYISKPVEEDKVLQVIDAGHWAPSAGNLQEWQFIVMRDQNKKSQIAEAALGQYWIAQSSVVIIICTKDDRVTRIYGDIGKNRFVYYDAACAIQNMLLMANNIGLGACFIGTFDDAAIKRIANIPEDITVHALITLGYPAEKPSPPHRLGIEDLTFFDEYGRKWVKGIPKSIRSDYLKKI
jgi:nitroreductase